MSESDSTNAPMRWPQILGYGLGDFANNLVFSLGAIFLLNYYTDVAGFGAATAGSLILIIRVYSAVTDVAAGRAVDRLGARTARFRSFLLWGAIPLMLANWAAFSIPSNWDYGSKLVYAAITYGLLVTAYSFVNIPYGALASAMTQEPHGRALLGASRTAMSLIGGLSVAVLISSLVGEALDKREGIRQLLLFVSAIGLALYLACYKLTRENVAQRTSPVSTWNSIRSVLENRALMVLCAATFLTVVGAFSMSASVVYFVRYVLRDPSQLAVIIAMTAIPGTVVASLLVPGMVKRFGKKPTCVAGLALASASYFGLFALAPSTPFFVYTSFALIGCGQTAAGVTTWALAADTVEYGEWRSGIRIEGATYAAFSATRKIAQAIGGALPAFLLGFTGYAPNLAVQSAAATFGIWANISLIPAIAFLLAGLTMFMYPVSDRHFRQLVEDIRSRAQRSR